MEINGKLGLWRLSLPNGVPHNLQSHGMGNLCTPLPWLHPHHHQITRTHTHKSLPSNLRHYSTLIYTVKLTHTTKCTHTSPTKGEKSKRNQQFNMLLGRYRKRMTVVVLLVKACSWKIFPHRNLFWWGLWSQLQKLQRIRNILSLRENSRNNTLIINDSTSNSQKEDWQFPEDIRGEMVSFSFYLIVRLHFH